MVKDNNLQVRCFKKSEIIGEKSLKIFKIISPKSQLNDWAIISGGFYNYYQYLHNNGFKFGPYWTETPNYYTDAIYINSYGKTSINSRIDTRTVGFRPVVSLSAILPYSNNIKNLTDNDIELEFGIYLNNAVAYDQHQILEKLYNENKLTPTNYQFTRDSQKHNNYNLKFNPEFLSTFKYNDKYYTRAQINSCYDKMTLSNNMQYQNGEYAWFEVLPLKWYGDIEADIAFTKKTIIEGIQFNNERNYQGDFSKTDANIYLNEFFIKDITQNIPLTKKLKTKQLH